MDIVGVAATQHGGGFGQMQAGGDLAAVVGLECDMGRVPIEANQMY